MFKTLEGSKLSGSFGVAGVVVAGELTIDRVRTSLYLWHSTPFDVRGEDGFCLDGVLRDRRKVSLLDCVPLVTSGSGGGADDRYHFAEVFPHYVVVGDSHVDAKAPTVSKVHFLVSDAKTLFRDYDAFRLDIDSSGWVEQIARARGCEVEIGSHPWVGYFTGKYEIVSVPTAIATISACHRPAFSTGGAGGLSIDNSIWVTLAFAEPIAFGDAIDHHTWTVLKFLELLIGREQEVERLTVELSSERDYPSELEVYWSRRPQRNADDTGREPHPADVLISGADEKEQFSAVLCGWLDLHPLRRSARSRFFTSFLTEAYDVDLVIRSANMFDILPDSALPAPQEISDDLRAAQAACREIVDRLPESIEQQRLRTALGRIGELNLKQKIRHRAKFVVDAFSPTLAGLEAAVDEAVNCRNYYVHGGKPRFNYNDNFAATAFLSDTLAFVFGVSELLDSGWNPSTWSRRIGVGRHPFVHYLLSYRERLAQLRALLPQSGQH